MPRVGPLVRSAEVPCAPMPRRRGRAGGALCLALLLNAASAHALEGDTLRPFVELALAVEDNLFRFRDDAQARASALAAPIQGTHYRRLSAGMDLDWRLGRQRLSGRIAGDDTHFSRHADLLDYTGQDIHGTWHWQLGNRWSGTLSAARKRTQGSYADFSGPLVSNVSTTDAYGLSGEYWLHPDWRVHARLSVDERTYSAPQRRSGDVEQRTSALGVYRQGGAFERLGLEVVDIRGEFPHRIPTPTLDTRYDERAWRAQGTWRPTGATLLGGYVGHVERSHPRVAARGFSGMEWRVNARWMATGKTVVDLDLTRDLRNSEDSGVNYLIADAYGLGVTWRAGARTRVNARATHERIDYEGSARNDRNDGVTLSVGYELWRGGEVALGARHAWRRSSDARRDFDANAVFLTTRLQF